MKRMANVVKKKNWLLNAEMKTISDYALILEHCNGYSQQEARRRATESKGKELYETLLKRNEELFKTGTVIIFG